jgi:hypothetical protein
MADALADMGVYGVFHSSLLGNLLTLLQAIFVPKRAERLIFTEKPVGTAKPVFLDMSDYTSEEQELS